MRGHFNVPTKTKNEHHWTFVFTSQLDSGNKEFHLKNKILFVFCACGKEKKRNGNCNPTTRTNIMLFSSLKNLWRKPSLYDCGIQWYTRKFSLQKRRRRIQLTVLIEKQQFLFSSWKILNTLKHCREIGVFFAKTFWEITRLECWCQFTKLALIKMSQVG